MDYKFPIINHIDDVLPHIEGRKEFVVAERDGFTVINYQVAMPATFSRDEEGWEIRRECRGITFYPDGTVAARKFSKFFNVNERDETQFNVIDLDASHVILHKLDGSMITPFVNGDVHMGNNVRWHTKMGDTDVAQPVNEFVKKNPQYNDLAIAAAYAGDTPIFEWTSRKNRIVIDYAVDNLVLLAIRHNVNGEYVKYENMVLTAEDYGVPVVDAHEATLNADFMEYVRDLIGLEGFVVRFDTGHMVKIKAEDYLKLHRAKDAISQEKNVWAMILDADVDDLKGFLSDEDRVRIEKFETVLWEQVNENIQNLEQYFAESMRELDMCGIDFNMFQDPERERKKHFATVIVPSWPARYTAIAFKMYDGNDAREQFLKFVRSNLGTKNKLEAIRYMFNGLRFEEQEEE